MNKKILTVGSSAIAAVLLVFVVSTMTDTTIETQEFVLSEPQIPSPTMVTLTESPIRAPPTPIMKFVSHPIEYLEQSHVMLSYKVTEPVLPKGYTVQGISANPESNTFLMLLSEKEVTESTTRTEFFADGGIIIFAEDQSKLNVDRTAWMEGFLEQNNGQELSVKGKTGVSHDIRNLEFADSSILTNPGRVIFFDNNVIYEVKGIANTSDLLKIAESLN